MSSNPTSFMPTVPINNLPGTPSFRDFTDPLPEVPEYIKEIPNWVRWKLESDSDGNPTKVPYQVNSTYKASSTNPNHWSTYKEACDGMTISGTQGVGFVVSETTGLVGVDIDGCRNPLTGEIKPWASEIIDGLNSYTEITPSKTGMRVWVRGQIPGKDKVFNLDPEMGYGDKVKIEVYDRARYFTVTGQVDVYAGTSQIETRDIQPVYAKFDKLRAKNLLKETARTANLTVSTSKPVQIESKSEFSTSKYDIFKYGTITSGKPFVIETALGVLEYPSQSEADLAFVTVLALKFNNDTEKIDQEFRNSPMYREKWERLGADTIAKAIMSADKVRAEKQAPAVPSLTTGPLVSVSGDDFLVEDIAPRKVLISTIKSGEPVIFEQSINQVFAWRGIGKTCLGLGFVQCLATGGYFLNYRATEKTHVLYIEGELPDAQLQERWKSIVGPTYGYAHVCSIDKQKGHSYTSLATPEGRQKVESTLEELRDRDINIKVLFLDNISTLFNIEANDEEVWISIQSWFTSLRSRGYAIIFFHHAGKAGKSRSHSKSEDMLDLSIKLEAPNTETEDNGLHCRLSYDKARAGLSEKPCEIKLHRTHSDKCACGGNPVLYCPGDGTRWEILAATTKQAEANLLFEQGYSVSKVKALLGDTAEGTIRTWRTVWGAKKDQETKDALRDSVMNPSTEKSRRAPNDISFN